MTSSALYDELRALIFEVAAQNDKIGPLEESLKWGQPSFTPKRKNTGSSVRLSKQDDGTVGMFFICTTKLVDRFKELYPSAFDYRGSRTLMFVAGQDYDREALKHCIGMALTYKLKK
jgi:hypothetical protein